jgi:hypothetical protein
LCLFLSTTGRAPCRGAGRLAFSWRVGFQNCPGRPREGGVAKSPPRRCLGPVCCIYIESLAQPVYFFLVEGAYTQQGRAHIRRLHPDWAARPGVFFCCGGGLYTARAQENPRAPPPREGGGGGANSNRGHRNRLRRETIRLKIYACRSTPIYRARAAAGIGSACGPGASPTPDPRGSARDAPRCA